MSDLVSVRSGGLNHGKSLVLAVLLTGVGAVLIFILSSALLIHQDFTGSIYENGVPRALAGLFLLLFPYIHQRLAGRQRTSFSCLPDGIVSLEAYTLPWFIVLTYGVIIAFALAGISLLLVWSIGLVTAFFITRLIAILSWVILLVTFYYLGFWTGARNTHSPVRIASGVVLGYLLLELLVSVLLDIDSPLRGLFGLVIFLIPSLAVALVGTRSGKRRRLSHYVHFLLFFLPESDRQTVVERLYRDVRQRTREKHNMPDELVEMNETSNSAPR